MLAAYPAMGIEIQQTTAQPACTWSTSEHVMRERAGLVRPSKVSCQKTAKTGAESGGWLGIREDALIAASR
jgi:hypothetical protein